MPDFINLLMVGILFAKPLAPDSRPVPYTVGRYPATHPDFVSVGAARNQVLNL